MRRVSMDGRTGGGHRKSRGRPTPVLCVDGENAEKGTGKKLAAKEKRQP
jgi:hypothetical protein